MRAPAEHPLARGIEQDRGRQHDGHQGIRERARANVLEPVIDLHRGHPQIIEHERCAQLGERPYENNGAAREQAGQNERKGNAPKLVPTGSAQVGGGLLHGRVDVRHGSHGIQVEDRIEMQRLGHGHGPEPAHGQPVHGLGPGHQIHLHQDGVENPVLTQELPQPDRADKRRQDHGRQDQAGHERLAREVIPRRQQHERHGDDYNDGRGRQGHAKAVAQAFDSHRVPEHLGEEPEREMAVLDKAAGENPRQGPEKEHPENRQCRKTYRVCAKVFHALRQTFFMRECPITNKEYPMSKYRTGGLTYRPSGRLYTSSTHFLGYT